LHRAASAGKVEIVKMLLRNGENINRTDKEGWTPLHDAAYKGNTETVKVLIASGAKINAKSRRHVKIKPFNILALPLIPVGIGVDILRLLEGEPDFSFAGELLDCVSDTVQIKKRQTPKNLAKKENHTEIVKLLKAAGGHK
jgi:ankyrin repeat protein